MSALESVEASFGVGFNGRPAAFDPMTSWRKENVAGMVSWYGWLNTEHKRCQPDVIALVRRGFLVSWAR